MLKAYEIADAMKYAAAYEGKFYFILTMVYIAIYTYLKERG